MIEVNGNSTHTHLIDFFFYATKLHHVTTLDNHKRKNLPEPVKGPFRK